MSGIFYSAIAHLPLSMRQYVVARITRMAGVSA